MPRIRHVREEDGTVSPYRERKISDSIHQALRDSGSDDRGLADELAGVVSLFLERTYPDGAQPPRVADIQDTIERVLRETGNEPAARRFRKMRQQREELRDQIVVRGTARRASGDLVAPSDLPGTIDAAKWSRTRLVRSLLETAELPAAVAEEVASVVERRVFGLGLKTISADLIRHLVECELFERGIETGDRAGERIPISVRSLTDDLFGQRPGPDARPPIESIAGAVLEHYALAEVHGAAVSSAHSEGVLHLHGLDTPLAVERLALPWDLAVRPASGSGARALLDLRRTLEALRPHVAGAIELVDAVPRLLAGGGDPAAAIGDMLDAVLATDAYGRPAGPAVEITVPLETPLAAVRTLVDRVGEKDSGAVRVRFVHPGSLAPAAGEALAAAFQLMRTSRWAVLDLGSPEEPAPKGGPAGFPLRLQFSLARVTLNLPLLLMDASGTDLKDVLARLDRGAKLALEAFQERAWLQRKGALFGLPGAIEILGGPGRVVVPASGQEVDLEVWGLPHALELLVRRGVLPRPSVPEAAARILGHVLYHLGEEKDGVQFVVRTGGCTSRAVRRRMLTACETNARRLGVPDLLAELRNERAAEGLLPLAIPLGERRNRPLLSSRIVERLGYGLGVAEACIPGGLSEAGLEGIRAASRIRTLVLAPPGAGAPFEVQEELFA